MVDTKEPKIEIIHTELDDEKDLQQPLLDNESDIPPAPPIENDETDDDILPDDFVFGLMGAAEGERENTSTNIKHKQTTIVNPAQPIPPSEQTVPAPATVKLPVDEDLDHPPTVPESRAPSPGPSQAAPPVTVSEGGSCSTHATEALPKQEAAPEAIEVHYARSFEPCTMFSEQTILFGLLFPGVGNNCTTELAPRTKSTMDWLKPIRNE